MASLYEINSELLNYVSELDDIVSNPEQTDDDVKRTEELMKLLSINEGNFKGKADNYAKFVRVLEGNNLVIDLEVKRLQAMKKRNNSLISRLKETLLNAVKTFGVTETEEQEELKAKKGKKA